MVTARFRVGFIVDCRAEWSCVSEAEADTWPMQEGPRTGQSEPLIRALCAPAVPKSPLPNEVLFALSMGSAQLCHSILALNGPEIASMKFDAQFPAHQK